MNTKTPHTQRIGYLIKRIQHEMRKKMDIELKQIRLTTAQYLALSHLEEFPGLSNADLARKSFLTPQTMNQIIVILEKVELISRSTHERNSRIQEIHLTEKGKATLKKAHKIVSGAEDDLISCLTENEKNNLKKYLEKIKTEG